MNCITISCPEVMLDGSTVQSVEDAINNVIGGSNSFGQATYKRSTVNYAVLSFSAPSSLLTTLDAMSRVVVHNVADGDGPDAVYNRITVYNENARGRGLQHLADMGLTRIPVEHP